MGSASVSVPFPELMMRGGFLEQTEIDDAFRSGASEYVLKPCEPEKLKEIVKDLISRKN